MFTRYSQQWGRQAAWFTAAVCFVFLSQSCSNSDFAGNKDDQSVSQPARQTADVEDGNKDGSQNGGTTDVIGGNNGNNNNGENGNNNGVNITDGSLQCVWNQAGYAAAIPGGPPGLFIPIDKYRSSGYYEGNDFVFNFLVLHNGNAPSQGDASLDTTQNYRRQTSYRAVIRNARNSTEQCLASATSEGTDERKGAGCFAATTKILLSSGVMKEIMLLSKNDLIRNPADGKEYRIAKIIAGPEKEPLLAVTVQNQTVRVTTKHPFLSMHGLIAASELKTGDLIFASKGKFAAVEVIEPINLDPRQMVYNLVIETESPSIVSHMVFADGVVTGDYYLQQQLANEANALVDAGLMNSDRLFSMASKLDLDSFVSR